MTRMLHYLLQTIATGCESLENAKQTKLGLEDDVPHNSPPFPTFLHLNIAVFQGHVQPWENDMYRIGVKADLFIAMSVLPG